MMAQVHEAQVERQLSLQRELNSLLQRKSAWTEQDVLRL